MKKIFLAVLLCVLSGFASAQVLFGPPTTTAVTGVTLVVTPAGSGTGTVASTDGKIIGCGVGVGTCSASYTIGSSVTLIGTPTGGSTFVWSTGTGSAHCSGTGPCNFAINVSSTVVGIFNASASNAVPPLVFGIDYNQLVSSCNGAGFTGNFPSTISHGVGRFWDAQAVLWPAVEPSRNTFNFTTMDNELCAMANSSVKAAHMVLARTPFWATSGGNYNDAGDCNYFSYGNSKKPTAISESGTTVTVTSTLNPGVGNVVVVTGITPANFNGAFTVTSSNGTQFQYTAPVSGLGTGTIGSSALVGTPQNLTNSAPGQCDPPSDLNADGTGTNQSWRDWLGGLVSHVNQPGYIAGTTPFTFPHAYMQYYEIWNEPDTDKFFSNSYGTFDQLIRMTQDAYCIINHSSGTVSYTGESCATVRNAVTHGAGSSVVDTTKFPSFPTSPLDTNAKIMTPSYHTGGNPTGKLQCYLYCANPTSSPIGCSCTGSTCNSIGSGKQSCHTPGAAAFIDIINEHTKPGNNYAPTNSGTTSPSGSMEFVMNGWTNNAKGLQQAAELAKLQWLTESGYSGVCGFPDPSCPDNGSPFSDLFMQAGFVGDFYAYSYGLGWQENIWYNWNSSHGGLGPACAAGTNGCANFAFDKMYDWMVGATSFACANVGNVYTCTFNAPNSGGGTTPKAIVWDNAQTCSVTSGSEACTSSKQTVGSGFTTAADILNHAPVTIGTCAGCSAHQMLIFIYPQLLQ